MIEPLGIAAGINEYSRQTDVIAMTNYAQTVTVPGAMTGAPEPLDVAREAPA